MDSIDIIIDYKFKIQDTDRYTKINTNEIQKIDVPVGELPGPQISWKTYRLGIEIINGRKQKRIISFGNETLLNGLSLSLGEEDIEGELAISVLVVFEHGGEFLLIEIVTLVLSDLLGKSSGFVLLEDTVVVNIGVVESLSEFFFEFSDGKSHGQDLYLLF